MSADTADLATDEAVLDELGRRLAHARVQQQLTQQALADAAGVGKRTVERLEHGQPTQLGHYLQVLRALGLLAAWLGAHPDPRPTPMESLLAEHAQRPLRRRVRRRRAESPKPGPPPGDRKWGDEK